MEIDYKEFARLVDIRLKQIDEISKESFYFNKEYRELKNLRDASTELILLERNLQQEYDAVRDLEYCAQHPNYTFGANCGVGVLKTDEDV